MNWQKVFYECEPSKELSVNHLYFTTMKNGKAIRVMTKEGKQHKRAMAFLVHRKYKDLPDQMLEVKISIHGSWHFKNGNPRRMDVSNFIKLVEDALSEGLNTDDRWVWKVTAEKVEDSHHGIEIAWRDYLQTDPGPEA